VNHEHPRPIELESRPATVQQDTARSLAPNRFPIEVMETMPQPISEQALLTIWHNGMRPDEFACAVRAFGQLPECGQAELACLLAEAAVLYKTGVGAKRFSQPAQSRKRMKAFASGAESILEQFGFSPPEMGEPSAPWPLDRCARLPGALIVEFNKVVRERRNVASPVDGAERLFAMLLALSDLSAAATRCAEEFTAIAPQKSGRGGARRKVNLENELLFNIFEAYAALRQDFPASGPAPKYGRQLREFVRASLRLVVTAMLFTLVDGEPPKHLYSRLHHKTVITDDRIRSAFGRWSKSSKRDKLDLSIWC
jgi:hypothetical protein